MMKRIINILAVVITISCSGPERGSENLSVYPPNLISFGEEISAEGSVIATNYFSNQHVPDSTSIKLSGTIESVCQEKGCWMKLSIGNGEQIRVTFKDYGFFVPKNSAGHKTVIEGVLKKKVTDVETLQHYAKDEGKSDEVIATITEPKEEYSFVAHGVLID